jgi:hypothetical protein
MRVENITGVHAAHENGPAGVLLDRTESLLRRKMGKRLVRSRSIVACRKEVVKLQQITEFAKDGVRF